jgi:hypothetical protein
MAQNEFARLGDTLNNRLLELKKVSFLYTKEAYNYFAGPGDHLALVELWAV